MAADGVDSVAFAGVPRQEILHSAWGALRLADGRGTATGCDHKARHRHLQGVAAAPARADITACASGL